MYVFTHNAIYPLSLLLNLLINIPMFQINRNDEGNNLVKLNDMLIAPTPDYYEDSSDEEWFQVLYRNTISIYGSGQFGIVNFTR